MAKKLNNFVQLHGANKGRNTSQAQKIQHANMLKKHRYSLMSARFTFVYYQLIAIQFIYFQAELIEGVINSVEQQNKKSSQELRKRILQTEFLYDCVIDMQEGPVSDALEENQRIRQKIVFLEEEQERMGSFMKSLKAV